MSNTISRRDFLKLGLLALGGLAFRPYLKYLPPQREPAVSKTARIAVTSVSVYKEPWDESKILYQRKRDDLVNLYYEVVSDKGPDWNPIWYRVWGGYIHSKHLQMVDYRLNEVVYSIREGGQLGEVTVPYVQPMRWIANDVWEPVYPLYYESVHWGTSVVEGPDGGVWYRLQEAWSRVTYDVPAESIRLIPDVELTPLSPLVEPHKKRIEVSLAHQELTAYENDQVVLKTLVSTGLNRAVPDGEIPWNTPAGEWRVASKMPSQHMGDGSIVSDVEAYELLGVPWVCYFHENGNATHGTYWHTNFGNNMSHGCVNMRTADARWLFRWTTPVWDPGVRDAKGYGTVIKVT